MEKKRYIDLSGKTFGRWYVIERTPNVRPGVTMWKCQCECGMIKDHVLYTSLVAGRSNSCGCLRSDMLMKPASQTRSQRAGLPSATHGWPIMTTSWLIWVHVLIY